MDTNDELLMSTYMTRPQTCGIGTAPPGWIWGVPRRPGPEGQNLESVWAHDRCVWKVFCLEEAAKNKFARNCCGALRPGHGVR